MDQHGVNGPGNGFGFMCWMAGISIILFWALVLPHINWHRWVETVLGG